MNLESKNMTKENLFTVQSVTDLSRQSCNLFGGSQFNSHEKQFGNMGW